MSNRRKILLLVITAILVAISGLMLGLRQGSTEMAAREKLDNLLGQAEDSASPFTPYANPTPPTQAPSTTNAPPPGFLGLSIPNPLSGIPDSGVDVQEHPNAYIIRVPLTNAADARNVSVNVTPNHIEVSGNVGRREHGVSFTSSFMQSFSTSQPVLPDKVTRKSETVGSKTTLVITVPKQQPGKTNPALQAPSTPKAPVAPKAPKSTLNEDELPAIDDHRVI